MADFNTALQYVLSNEGTEYVNNPNDQPTKFGITLDTLSQWDKQQGSQVTTTAADVESLSEQEAAQIYQAVFWNRLNLALLNAQAPATAIFDMAVNMGTHQAVLLAQRACGSPGDGIFGPNTAASIATMSPQSFLLKFSQQVAIFYIGIVMSNPSKLPFLLGWYQRSQKMLTLS